ncbi:MAG: hypothetical protein DWQ08_06620 [Proteobacteria bacterium]|nr:MAG: hypothetical protein DWQ08_06620 [Pseudomonadota bacterium]
MPAFPRAFALALMLAGANQVPADELDDLAALWSIADEPYQPVTRELEEPAFRHRKTLSVTESSLADGWVPNRQCHANFPLFPALQISFREGAVRNMAIVERSGVEEAWVEEPTIQMKRTRPETTLCFTSENHTMTYDAASDEYSMTVGPYYLRLFDGYFPLDVDLTIEYPPGLLQCSGMEPAQVEGGTVAREPGRIRFGALFEGKLKLVFRFKPA